MDGNSLGSGVLAKVRPLRFSFSLCAKNPTSLADVKLNGFDKRYELNLSLYQLGVLLTLNDQKAAQITVGDVVKATHLSLGDVKRSVKVPFVFHLKNQTQLF